MTVRIALEEDMVGPEVVAIVLDTRTYGLTAIKKAAYRLASRCTVVLGHLQGDQVTASLTFRPGTSESDAQEAVRLFHQELLDEDLRERLREETDALRSLILAHAFSKVDLIERS